MRLAVDLWARDAPLPDRGLPGPAAGAGVDVGASPTPVAVSVVIALTDHRGHALRCIPSWTRDQDWPDDDYEILLLHDARDGALAEALAATLRPHDRVIAAPGAGIVRLTDIGVRAGRGAVAILTEPHCEAGPGTIGATARAFAAGDLDAAQFAYTTTGPNAHARVEGRLFHRSQAAHEAGGRSVLPIRGSAVRRAVYLASGGLDPALGNFAEVAFAGALAAAGRRVGRIAGASVCHHNTTALSDIRDSAASYVRGECRHIAAALAAGTTPCVALPPEWAQRGAPAARLARATWRDGPRLLASADAPRARRRVARALARLLPGAVRGARWPTAALRLRLALAGLHCRLLAWSTDRLDPVLERTWQLIARRERLGWLLRQPLPPRGIGPGTAALPAADAPGLLGFHAPEHQGGLAFRWSGPVAMIRLALPPGRHRVVLTLHPARADLAARDLTVALDGRVLPARAVAVAGGEIACDIAIGADCAAPQRLLLLCDPLRLPRGSAERRTLGLPLAGLAIVAQANGGAAPPAG